MSPDPNPLYDAFYYARGCGEPYQRSTAWLDMFQHIAHKIAVEIQPASVLDAGCAFGFLVEKLRSLGVEAWGIDVSGYAIQNVDPSVRPYCRVASVLDPLPQRYGLIVSIEVLEHLPPAQAEQAVANLCRFSDDILMSSTPFDFKEATHYNVQPPDYWAALFARQQFFHDLDFDASFITPWAMRFRRQPMLPYEIVRQYEKKHWLLAKEKVDLRSFANETQAELRRSLDASEILRQELEALHQQRDNPAGRLSAWLRRQAGRLRHRLLPPTRSQP